MLRKLYIRCDHFHSPLAYSEIVAAYSAVAETVFVSAISEQVVVTGAHAITLLRRSSASDTLHCHTPDQRFARGKPSDAK